MRERNYIDSRQKSISNIYPNSDKSVDYIMTHVYTNCAELGRNFLSDSGRKDMNHRVIKIYSWLIALANHFDIRFAEALYNRFPNSCPYCLSPVCKCDVTGKRAYHPDRKRVMSPEEHKRELDNKRSAINESIKNDFCLDSFVHMIRTVYPVNQALIKRGGAPYIIGKLLEEGGELHRAYSSYLRGEGKKGEVGQEIADIAAWTCSFWDQDGQPHSLDSEFKSLYADGCPDCHYSPCVCIQYSISFSSEEVIQKIARILRELADQEVIEGEETADIRYVEAKPASELTGEDRNKVIEVGRSVVKKAPAAVGCANNLISQLSKMIENFQ